MKRTTLWGSALIERKCRVFRAKMARTYLGRHVYGLAAVAFGIITLFWRDVNNWQRIQALGDVHHREILVYIAAAVQIFGGIAIQWPRTARVGAIVLGSIYLIFALLWVPRIVTEPRLRAAIASGVRRYLQQSMSDADRPLRLLMRDLILFSRIPNVWSPMRKLPAGPV
jgi:uncharacterized membrane protein YphA (DoxX/SURF4 family)